MNISPGTPVPKRVRWWSCRRKNFLQNAEQIIPFAFPYPLACKIRFLVKVYQRNRHPSEKPGSGGIKWGGQRSGSKAGQREGAELKKVTA
jgi:hypothetical protein